MPPNVFDHYTVFDAPLQDYLAATEALAATRLQAIERLEAELAELNGRLDDRTQQPAAAAGPHHGAVPAAMPLPAAVESPPAPADSRERIALPLGAGGLGRRVTRLAYGVVRPLVRPLAWRLRQFLIGELKGELDGHRIRLDQLIARPATSTEGGINPALLGRWSARCSPWRWRTAATPGRLTSPSRLASPSRLPAFQRPRPVAGFARAGFAECLG